jgi:sugar transferase (PEP-CTERM system associated)
VIRLFNVYYPVRTLLLVVGEAVVVWTSLLLGALLQYQQDSYLLLNFENGYFKLLVATATVLLLSHWFDLYDSAHIQAQFSVYFRLILVPGLLALTLAVVSSFFPRVLLGRSAFAVGFVVLTFALLCWRTFYSWLARQHWLREQVYVLGAGTRALRLVQGLRRFRHLGIEIVGWSGTLEPDSSRENLGSHLTEVTEREAVHRVIVAMDDRRAAMPMTELLRVRLAGVYVEEATSWLERISGNIELEQLHPSWIIFAKGFRFSSTLRILRNILSFSVALVGSLLTLPIIPMVALAIKLDSPGPVLYRQKRVGRLGKIFSCFKFRTMRRDAEADSGPAWAGDQDPRITRVGRFLRSSRLDEIPQLWCVLKGDMAFVGPRPERPEFVEWLSREIPYYEIRHMVRPGITGWAQVRYKYGNTVEDAKEKLQYDLFYIKNASIGMDIMIMFQTIKIVTLGRGAQ